MIERDLIIEKKKKTMSTHLIDRLIENFSVNNLISFLGSKLSGFHGQSEDYSHFLTNNQRAKYSDIYKIGETTINDSEFIIAIVAKTIDPLTERSGKKTQYDIAKTILKDEKADLAFFVFYDVDGNFRFSIIDVERANNQSQYSMYKRYSYYVSKEQTNKTFRNQVGDSNFTSIEEIVKAFSVEKLNRQFYDELSNWYFWATQCVTYPDDEEKKEDIRNATNVIRLITRLIFVWFLKQKKLVPDELFDKDKIDKILNYSDKTGSTYYKAILQNLFFATLNTEMTGNKRKFVHRQSGVQGFYRYERFFSSKDYFLELTQNIPFLNGGLFENLDREIDLPNGEKQIIRIDCFSNRRDLEEKLVVPDYLFFGETKSVNLNDAYGDKKHTDITVRGFIDILKSYNFTIEENNPIEIEVALDPELLGKVFENLLASYNPETQTTARKQSGSFYTPREIVDYMCDESLFIYLKEVTQDSIPEGKLRNLITYKASETNFTDTETNQLIEAIDNCKILDPACGSGAFPMGVLQKMVFILQKLDPENKKWKSIQKERAEKENKELIEKLEKDKELINQISSLPELKSQALAELDLRLKQIEDAFSLNTNELDYARKLFLIENCIYGVDIQPIAIQISKLRFFISLLVEQIVDNSILNRGIIPMPNMETKFVAANTLVALSKDNLIKPVSLYPLEAELKDVRNKHFSARTPETKKKYRHEDKRLRKEIGEILKDSGFPPTSAEQIANWNPYNQNASADWFDSEWMFGISDGFDIVIGNPPYLRIQGIRDSNPKLADELTKNYKSASGSFDLYVTFVEKSLGLINSNGLVNFIMPTKWTNAAFGKGLREVIAEKKAANKIINFGAYQVFNASTYTGIQYFRANSDGMMYYELNRNLSSNEELAQYLQSLTPIQGTLVAKEKLTREIWTLTAGGTSKIIEKLNLQPRRISDVFDKIFQGLATSKDDVYFLYDCMEEKNKVVGFSKQLDKTIQIEREFVKPLLKGEDVHRYDNITTNRFVVFPYNLEKGNAVLYKEDEIKKQFPLAYAYLKECEDVLRDREKGRFNIDGEWFQFGRKQGINFAEKEKLVAPEISLGGNFAYDKNGRFYSSTTIYGYVKKQKVKDSYKSLLAILNSKLFWWYLMNTGTVLTNGYFRFKTNYILPFPMPIISEEIILSLEKYADKILEAKTKDRNANTKEFEEEINTIVYGLYNLTLEEIEFIKKT